MVEDTHLKLFILGRTVWH